MPNNQKQTFLKTVLPILVLGLGLRVIALNQSLWLDEAITGMVAKSNLAYYLNSFAPTDFHPPLHYLLEMVVVHLFSPNDLVLRLPSVLFGVATIAIVYVITQKIKPDAAWVAALFIAVNPLHIYYSQEARMYALATFLVAAAVLGWIKLEQKNTFSHKLLFTVSLATSLLTHYATVFMLPVFLFVSRKKRHTMFLILLALLPLLIWSPILLKQLQAGLGQTGVWAQVLGYTTPKNVLLLPVKFALGRISLEPFILYLAVAAFVLLSYFFIIMRNPRLLKQKLIWSWFLFPAIATALIAFQVPIFSYFRLLYVLPAAVILLALGAQSYQGNVKKLIAVLLVSGVSLSAAQAYLTNPEFHREPWKQALNRIDSNLPESTLAIFTFSGLPAPWQWYRPSVPVETVVPTEDWQTRLAKVNLFSTIALFEYGADIFDPNREVLNWLTSHGFEEKGFYQYPGIGKIRILTRDQPIANLPISL